MKEYMSNGFADSIAQAIEEMKAEQGDSFSLESINLAELERRTGVSRGKLRRLKRNGFRDLPRVTKGGKHKVTKLSGYTGLIDSLLRQGSKNSSVVLDRLRQAGYEGGATIVKEYIASHKHLLPAKRQQVAPQGNRGRRYTTEPGEAFQMDWGFTKVLNPDGTEFQVACFAMICHHCGHRYVEFFPNARQENLFIGIIHAFQYMGVPRFVLTDNMKSVIIRRDMEGHPVWQKDYEAFMKAVGFQTKLCKPRHPFTKGKVERLIRFVKENFLIDRVFANITDLNWQALEWCNRQNSIYHRAVSGVPQQLHLSLCGE
jgi:transposase